MTRWASRNRSCRSSWSSTRSCVGVSVSTDAALRTHCPRRTRTAMEASRYAAAATTTSRVPAIIHRASKAALIAEEARMCGGPVSRYMTTAHTTNPPAHAHHQPPLPSMAGCYRRHTPSLPSWRRAAPDAGTPPAPESRGRAVTRSGAASVAGLGGGGLGGLAGGGGGLAGRRAGGLGGPLRGACGLAGLGAGGPGLGHGLAGLGLQVLGGLLAADPGDQLAAPGRQVDVLDVDVVHGLAEVGDVLVQLRLDADREGLGLALESVDAAQHEGGAAADEHAGLALHAGEARLRLGQAGARGGDGDVDATDGGVERTGGVDLDLALVLGHLSYLLCWCCWTGWLPGTTGRRRAGTASAARSGRCRRARPAPRSGPRCRRG